MREYQRADRSTTLFVVLIVISFLLMTLDVRAAGAGVSGTLRDGVQAVFSPLQRAADAVVGPMANVVDGVANVAGLRAENRRLRAELETIRAEMESLEALKAENAELRALLNMPLPATLLETQTVATQVVAMGTTNFDYTIVLGKGLEDGLAVDMPVVDERGLVGRIVSVTDHSATVSLIIDPQQSVAVRAAQSRDVGVVTGRGTNVLGMVIFDATGPLAESELVVTAGSDLYPPGLVVGRVVAAARPEAGFILQTAVEPVVEFGKLDYVRVVQWSAEISPMPVEEDEEPAEEDQPETATP